LKNEENLMFDFSEFINPEKEGLSYARYQQRRHFK